MKTPARRTARQVALAYRVDDAAAMLGIGKSKMWELIAAGRIRARKIDGATIVPHAELEAFLEAAPLASTRHGPS